LAGAAFFGSLKNFSAASTLSAAFYTVLRKFAAGCASAPGWVDAAVVGPAAAATGSGSSAISPGMAPN